MQTTIDQLSASSFQGVTVSFAEICTTKIWVVTSLKQNRVDIQPNKWTGNKTMLYTLNWISELLLLIIKKSWPKVRSHVNPFASNHGTPITFTIRLCHNIYTRAPRETIPSNSKSTVNATPLCMLTPAATFLPDPDASSPTTTAFFLFLFLCILHFRLAI